MFGPRPAWGRASSCRQKTLKPYTTETSPRIIRSNEKKHAIFQYLTIFIRNSLSAYNSIVREVANLLYAYRTLRIMGTALICLHPHLSRRRRMLSLLNALRQARSTTRLRRMGRSLQKLSRDGVIGISKNHLVRVANKNMLVPKLQSCWTEFQSISKYVTMSANVGRWSLR